MMSKAVREIQSSTLRTLGPVTESLVFHLSESCEDNVLIRPVHTH